MTLFKNNYLKSILTLASGSIIAQLISFLLSPVITRIFTPAELGIYTLLLSAVNIFSPAINLRYDLAIVTVEDDREAIILVKLSIYLMILIDIIVTCGTGIYFFLNGENLVFIIPMFFLLLLVSGITNILNSFNNRLREYKLITSVYVIRTFFQNILQIFSGILLFGSYGLIFSNFIGQLAGIKRQSKSLSPYYEELKNVDYTKMKLVFFKYIKQPLYSTPAAFANSFSYSSINLFIQALFNDTILGLYSLSYRVLGLPLTMISGNVSKVYMESATKELYEQKNYYNSFKKTTLLLSIVAILMVIVLFLFAPFLFHIVFGSNWKEAGIYVQILAPMFGLRLIVSALSVGTIISQKQDLELKVQVMFLAFSFICFFISKYFQLNIYLYLDVVSITYSIIYIYYFICLKNISQKIID